MGVGQRPDQGAAPAQSFRKPRGIIAGNRQTAEGFRSIQRERADDRMATGQQGPVHDLQIGILIGGFGQEMKRGLIMPVVRSLGGSPVQTVPATRLTGAASGSRFPAVRLLGHVANPS